ncbi:hydroxyacylglutathione hydrolase [Chitinibacter bivalviorum]|uniref:Hydroxyacylglutathione hydrolase n=1 Tax=Chitinibacter bivalviorum TaxID=2739434 RepID=A0A7H9BJT7_9NEIS|nr:hydroxyacylglutathione hydrolase [Chitinibacter bivalviorum]QLG88632.1 hydroxyacylglutathione hydrolase [Chitinibacter bivalviorum]
MLNISAIPIYEDNYIWVLHQGSKAIAVDPGEAAPLQAWLRQHQCTLEGVLITHHHGDHTGGLHALVHADLPIYGPAAIAHINRPLQGGESLTLLGENFTVFATPGHTLDHLSYYGAGALFCGDTLFSAGCGRLFEGTAAQMFASLQQLASLPSETKLCCTHEYTLSNLRFALAVEPNNRALQTRYDQVCALRAAGQMSLPSTLAIELASNPFLRCEQAEVVAAARAHNANIANAVDTFAALRQWKDHFR